MFTLHSVSALLKLVRCSFRRYPLTDVTPRQYMALHPVFIMGDDGL